MTTEVKTGLFSSETWAHSNAQWIWSPEYDPDETNVWFSFEAEVEIGKVDLNWWIDITADSRYRLRINGSWVTDGPARGYPDALFFDRVPVTEYLKEGGNTITVEVTHFGVDTFQYVRGVPGLLFALYSEGQKPIIESNLSWRVTRVVSHRSNTPRISCQLGFEEQIDLTIQISPATSPVLSGRARGLACPQLRDICLLSREVREFTTVISHSQVRPISNQWTIHLRELLGSFPGGVNTHGLAGIVGAELQVSSDETLEISLLGQVQGLNLDGNLQLDTVDQDLRRYQLILSKGSHWLTVAVCDRYDHVFELSIGASGSKHTQWRSPPGKADSPWVTTGPLWRALKSSHCPISTDGTIDPEVDVFGKDQARLQNLICQLSACKNPTDFFQTSPTQVTPIAGVHHAEADAYFTIRTDKETTRSAESRPFDGNVALASGNRVLLDMEDIVNGYLAFELATDGNSALDILFFEHLETKDGVSIIQYLQSVGNSYRTSLRLTVPKGIHSFLSTQRRGFRYCLLTLRSESASIRLSKVAVIESLYQPKQRAAFHSSDARLDQIFRMSQRTLLLCMEDTFTDCPSYEQTFWVGDARNESLFAAITFGAYDLNERCSRLVSDSLRTLPMAASQCPSGWDVIIPSFSFLWVISVWETYWQSGHANYLKEMYAAVRKTLDTAVNYCVDRNLFSAPTWNFMEWAPMDISHSTVIHNSIFLARALEVGSQIADTLGDADQSEIYRKAREKLADAVNLLWRKDVGAYPDSIRESGEVSSRVSQHNSILALLYDLIPNEERRKVALTTCLETPPGMTSIASPFAMFFLLDCLLKLGLPHLALGRLRSFWSHMLEADSPTCWEMVYPPTEPFPTRSYCHGWSAAPVYLLPFVFFGIEVLEAGWKTVRIRPQNFGLDFVEVTVCTPAGMMSLRQAKQSDGTTSWTYEAPEGVRVVS